MLDVVRIYTLSDPESGRVRYVGRTINSLQRRLREHITVARRGKLKDKSKEQWIIGLASAGMVPIIGLVETVSRADFQVAEKKWVAHFRESHPDLLNVKCGGDGGLGGHFVEWTPELDAMLGRVSDSKLARQIGVTRKTVSYRREKLGIPASFDRTDNVPPPAMGGHNKLNLSSEVIARFGKEPDYRIAAELGVDKSMIARRRKAMGIASYAETAGMRGVFYKGMPHPRWSRRNGAESSPKTN